MWDMTRLYLGHDLSKYDKWLIHMWDMTHIPAEAVAEVERGGGTST